MYTTARRCTLVPKTHNGPPEQAARSLMWIGSYQLPAGFAPPAAEAAAATATIAAATAATATTEGALLTRTSFIHIQLAASEVSAIQRVDSTLGFFVVGHFNERKAARAASFTVRDDADAVHGSICFKQAPH